MRHSLRRPLWGHPARADRVAEHRRRLVCIQHASPALATPARARAEQRVTMPCTVGGRWCTCRRVTAVVYVCGVKTLLTKPLHWLIVLHHKRVPQLIGAAQRAREAGETRESEQSVPSYVCNTPIQLRTRYRSPNVFGINDRADRARSRPSALGRLLLYTE